MDRCKEKKQLFPHRNIQKIFYILLVEASTVGIYTICTKNIDNPFLPLQIGFFSIEIDVASFEYNITSFMFSLVICSK
jgi:hypothetical protein